MGGNVNSVISLPIHMYKSCCSPHYVLDFFFLHLSTEMRNNHRGGESSNDGGLVVENYWVSERVAVLPPTSSSLQEVPPLPLLFW